MSVVPSTIWSTPSRPLQYAKAIAESDLAPGVRAACWALSTFADNNTGKAWPSVKRLAKALGLSEAVVSTHTGTAESMGYLSKARRAGNSNIYTITVPVVEVARTPSPADTAPEPPPWIKDIVDDIDAGLPQADT